MSKHVDIILPVWNNLNYTKMCISSILDKTEMPYHLIVVNNGSTDGTKEYLESIKRENITIIHNKENLGWCKALNQGIKTCNGEYVLFLNNDTIVSEGWLRKLSDKIKEERVAAVGPISNAVSGRQNIIFNSEAVEVEEAPFLIGFCLMVKRSILNMLYEMDGYYIDERFGLGGAEELDLAIRIRRLGFKMLITRNVYIHHFLSKSLEKITDDIQKYCEEKNEVLFEKWGEEYTKEMLTFLPKVMVGIPSLGYINPKFFLSCLFLLTPYRITWNVITRTLPDIARNKIVEQALEYGFDYILFLDDDMAFDDRELLVKLMKHNVDIVGVNAYTRLPPYYPCVFKKAEIAYNHIDVHGQGLVEVDAMGMSCVLIKTKVFRKIEKPWFEFKPIKIQGQGEERIGEDVYFFEKAKKAGFKVYCDGNINIWHIGERMLVNHEIRQKYIKEMEEKSKPISEIKLAEV